MSCGFDIFICPLFHSVIYTIPFFKQGIILFPFLEKFLFTHNPLIFLSKLKMYQLSNRSSYNELLKVGKKNEEKKLY